MKKVLLTAFKGNNSSKEILNHMILDIDKLCFTNSFEISKKELLNKFKNNKYDFIISMGHKPVIKKIYIEILANKDNVFYDSNFDYLSLFNFLKSNNYELKISNNAGNYLCNHIYFEGLKYIKENDLNTKMIFIHLPYLKNINNINKLIKDLSVFVELL